MQKNIVVSILSVLYLRKKNLQKLSLQSTKNKFKTKMFCSAIIPSSYWIIMFIGILILLVFSFITTQNTQIQYTKNHFIILLYHLVILGQMQNVHQIWDKTTVLANAFMSCLYVIFFIYLLVCLYQSTELPYELSLLFYVSFWAILLMLQGQDLFLIFATLELQAILFYTLIAIQKQLTTLEGALKYFFVSVIAAALFNLGISFIYGATGTTRMDYILLLSPNNSYLLLGAGLLICGLFIKLGVAPYHFWLIDAYGSTNFLILLFLLSIPKLPLFFLIFSFITAFPMTYFLLISIGFSAIFGAIGAFNQRILQRFLAYSVTFNLAFFLSFLLYANYLSLAFFVSVLYIYLFVTFLNITPFLLLQLTTFKNSLFELLTLRKSHYVLGLVISIAFLSSAGFPPFLGFFQKFLCFVLLLSNASFVLGMFLVLCSLLVAYNYLRLTTTIFFFKASGIKFIRARKSVITLVVATLCVVTCSWIGFPMNYVYFL